MEFKDILTILSVLLSPVIAVRVDKYIETRKSKTQRKLTLFKTLMATRGSKLSMDHVIALNQIDVEFYDKKYVRVLHAWKEYLDQLNVKFTDNDFTIWNERSEELLANLLWEMGLSLGYTFDKVTIRRNAYAPIGHSKIENEQQQIRELLIKVLNGENSLSMLQFSPEEIAQKNNNAQDRQLELQSLLINYYKNLDPIKIKIIKDDLPIE